MATKKNETVEETVATVENVDKTEVIKVVGLLPGEKAVRIKIPRERANQEDVPVWVNERSWMIKRGVYVEVPECVAEVLEAQEQMFEKINLFNDEKAKNY